MSNILPLHQAWYHPLDTPSSIYSVCTLKVYNTNFVIAAKKKGRLSVVAHVDGHAVEKLFDTRNINAVSALQGREYKISSSTTAAINVIQQSELDTNIAVEDLNVDARDRVGESVSGPAYDGVRARVSEDVITEVLSRTSSVSKTKSMSGNVGEGEEPLWNAGMNVNVQNMSLGAGSDVGGNEYLGTNARAGASVATNVGVSVGAVVGEKSSDSTDAESDDDWDDSSAIVAMACYTEEIFTKSHEYETKIVLAFTLMHKGKAAPNSTTHADVTSNLVASNAQSTTTHATISSASGSSLFAAGKGKPLNLVHPYRQYTVPEDKNGASVVDPGPPSLSSADANMGIGVSAGAGAGADVDAGASVDMGAGISPQPLHHTTQQRQPLLNTGSGSSHSQPYTRAQTQPQTQTQALQDTSPDVTFVLKIFETTVRHAQSPLPQTQTGIDSVSSQHNTPSERRISDAKPSTISHTSTYVDTGRRSNPKTGRDIHPHTQSLEWVDKLVEVQEIPLSYKPFYVFHTRTIEGGHLLLLSGNDHSVHTYARQDMNQEFTERVTSSLFPELTMLRSTALTIDIRYLPHTTQRIVVAGCRSGYLKLSVFNYTTSEIELEEHVYLDGPVTACWLFVDKPTSNNEIDTVINLLVTCAVEAAFVYRDVIEYGLEDGLHLPGSSDVDSVMCCMVNNLSYSHTNSILLGTFGNKLLRYSVDPSTGGYILSEMYDVGQPVYALSNADVTGDGANELICLLRDGVLVLQVGLSQALQRCQSMLTIITSAVKRLRHRRSGIIPTSNSNLDTSTPD
eukprot:CFRG3498T1